MSATPRVYQARIIASALGVYANTGIKVNSGYTPTAMLRTATNITGKAYKRGQYLIAAADLKEWADEQ